MAGMMAPVPSEWQAKLGGPALTGQCCIPIVYADLERPGRVRVRPGDRSASHRRAQRRCSTTRTIMRRSGPWSGSNPDLRLDAPRFWAWR